MINNRNSADTLKLSKVSSRVDSLQIALRVPLPVPAEPMRTPKRLKIAETRARLIAVDWESLGYNITRCHTFNVTICYHYMTANNRSKADCLDMDPKGNRL